MKYLNGKLLSIVLLCLCILMFTTLAPNWVILTAIAVVLVYCIISMIKTGFFG